MNSSVDGDKIILRKNINIGIAVARPDGNLIVPVIKNAEQRNVVGLSKELNRLASAARRTNFLPTKFRAGHLQLPISEALEILLVLRSLTSRRLVSLLPEALKRNRRWWKLQPEM